MIRVNFLKTKSGNICGFEASGHANHGKYGEDIVCSAVSSVIYMVINTITEVMKIDADITLKDTGYVYICVSDKDMCLSYKVMMEGLKIHLLSLEKDYFHNIRVRYKEVR